MAAHASVTTLPKPAHWTSFAAAAIGVAFYVAVSSLMLPYARQHDFQSFYTGAALVRDGHAAQLYDYDLQTRYGTTSPYIRPPFYALPLTPLALLSLENAFAVWIAVQIGALLAVWWWAYRRFGADALVFAALFHPVLAGIANGQDCAILLLILLGAFWAAERGQDRLAGVLLGLALFKFHLLLLLPAAMLVRRRWRMLAG